MQNLENWMNIAIWGMAIFDWVLCGILARAIALEKGHSPEKSLFFGVMGPFSLVRFLMEGFPLRKPANKEVRSRPRSPVRPSPGSITYEDYRSHHRFRELLELVAYDEETAIRLINYQRNNNPSGSLDRWIDHAIYNLGQNEEGQPFQYHSEDYE